MSFGAAVLLHAALYRFVATRPRIAPTSAPLPRNVVELNELPARVLPKLLPPTAPLPRADIHRPTLPKSSPLTSTSTSTSPSPPPRVDLFPKGMYALRDTPPNADRGDLGSSRLKATLDTGRDEHAMKSGLVDPTWRQAERAADGAFKPPAEIVDRRPSAQIFAHQMKERWAAPVQEEPAHFQDMLRDADRALAPNLNPEHARRAQNHFAQPVEWTNVELEAIIDAAGAIVELRIVKHSATKALDELALQTLRDALTKNSVRDPKGKTRSRWEFAASVWFTPPKAMPVEGAAGKVTGAVIEMMSVDFDGKSDHAFKRNVSTRVKLLSRTRE
jgi:hypothetical protein